MGALTVINGKLAAEPTVQQLGTEEKPIYMATLAVKSLRYDFVNRKKVSDMYTLQCQGRIAKRIMEDQEEAFEHALAKGDSIVAYAETQLHANGPVFFVKELRLLGHEGFELHICAGAIENGKHGEVERDDREDGFWANCRMRVPQEKYNNPEETTNRHYNISAWDGRAKTLGKHVIPEQDDKESDRRWIFIAGHSKTEKREWEDENGEEHVRYDTKTEVGLLEFTDVSTEPFSYGQIQEGGSTGELDQEQAAAMAAAAAAAEAAADTLEDEDIPF